MIWRRVRSSKNPGSKQPQLFFHAHNARLRGTQSHTPLCGRSGDPVTLLHSLSTRSRGCSTLQCHTTGADQVGMERRGDGQYLHEGIINCSYMCREHRLLTWLRSLVPLRSNAMPLQRASLWAASTPPQPPLSTVQLRQPPTRRPNGRKLPSRSAERCSRQCSNSSSKTKRLLHVWPAWTQGRQW